MPMAVSYTVIDGEIVSETRGGVSKAYAPDSLGSTIALYDASGNITDTWEYWPYGEVRTRTGTTPTPFQYVGTLGYYTDLTGNVYVRARSYQPKTTRWMRVDPFWPNLALPYAYSSVNPVSRIDPSGTWDFGLVGCDSLQRDLISKHLQKISELPTQFLSCLNQHIGNCTATPRKTTDPQQVLSNWAVARPGDARSHITIRCNNNSSGFCASSSHCAKATFDGGFSIELCFPQCMARPCGPLKCLLAHELIHLASGGVFHSPTNDVLWCECMRFLPGCEKYEGC